MTTRAPCPECGRLLPVQPPAGGDGSGNVYPRHETPATEAAIANLAATNGMSRKAARAAVVSRGVARCPASRRDVERDVEVDA